MDLSLHPHLDWTGLLQAWARSGQTPAELGPVNAIQGFDDQREVDEEGKYRIQLVEAGEDSAKALQAPE